MVSFLKNFKASRCFIPICNVLGWTCSRPCYARGLLWQRLLDQRPLLPRQPRQPSLVNLLSETGRRIKPAAHQRRTPWSRLGHPRRRRSGDTHLFEILRVKGCRVSVPNGRCRGSNRVAIGSSTVSPALTRDALSGNGIPIHTEPFVQTKNEASRRIDRRRDGRCCGASALLPRAPSASRLQPALWPLRAFWIHAR